MGNFYTYVLCDPRRSGTFSYEDFTFPSEPFYVGKGTKRRAWLHTRAAKGSWTGWVSANPHRNRVVQKIFEVGLEPEVVMIESGLSELDAFQLELTLINTIGRSNLHTGPLTNLSDGGGGNAGYRWTEEQRKAITGGVRSGAANSFFGKKHTEETKKLMSSSHPDCTGVNNTFYGKHHAEKSKQLISQKNFGRVRGSFSKEHRDKIAAANLGKHKALSPEVKESANRKRAENLAKYGHPSKRIYLVSTPNGIIIEVKGLKRWCSDNGVNYHMLLLTAREKRKDWNGYSCTIKAN